MKDTSRKHIDNLIISYPKLKGIEEEIIMTCQEMIFAYQNKHKVLVCGNGGSASDSEHIVGELMKGFVLPRKIDLSLYEKLKIINPESADYLTANLQYGLPAISLVSQTSLITAIANDRDANLIYAQQVLGYGQKGDILIAISTSGNSNNIVYAAEVAKALGLIVISLTGENDSKLSQLSDIAIKVPQSTTFKVQEYHLTIYHAICLAIENEFFGTENIDTFTGVNYGSDRYYQF